MADYPDKYLIHCLIADDEPLARIGMTQLVKQVSFFNLAGTAKDAVEIIHYLNSQRIDLLFLDIQMPKLTGIELLKTLKNPPKVIITSAYPEYAIEGYELDILDYLLKPLTLQRFLKAANKAKDFFESTRTNATAITEKTGNDFIFIKTNGCLEKIIFDDILFIKAALNYVTIYTKEHKFITYTSIKKIADSLPSLLFQKVHKSYIIAISKVNAFNGHEVKIEQHSIPVSRMHKATLLKILEGL
jgi:two-component system LytT family response regulator